MHFEKAFGNELFPTPISMKMRLVVGAEEAIALVHFIPFFYGFCWN